MTMIDTFTIIGIVVIAVTLVAYGKWDISLSRAVLRDWAEREGLELIESKHRSLFRGPFTWNSKKEQAVYLIKARTATGTVRTGWVRLGQNAWTADVEWLD
jgi:hypothetical protein